MPDDLIKYSDAIRDAEAPSLNTTDVFAIAQEDAGSPTGYSSKATKLLAIANEVVKGLNYSSDLQTTSKTIIGAINEVKSSAKENLSDLTDTTITTPSNADLLAYDSSTSKWVNTKWVSGTLTTGNTTLTLSDASILTTSTIDIYVDTFGIQPTNAVVSMGSITLTFLAQASDISVKVRVS